MTLADRKLAGVELLAVNDMIRTRALKAEDGGLCDFQSLKLIPNLDPCLTA
jgi:hypothetical protein